MSDGKRKVLIVDDEVSFTRLLRMNLEEDGGYEVHVVNEARKGYLAARAFRPHIILLDVMMPDGSGGDVASAVERDPELRNIPITFLTAAVKRQEIGGSSACIGGKTFLAKPVKFAELVEHIEGRLAGKKR